MIVLGIKLHAPNAGSLFVGVMIAALCAALVMALTEAGALTLSNVAAPFVGVLAGILSHACGVSVLRQGWRGMVLVAGFVAALALVAFCALTLIH
ncbi:MAG: hypothetical protein ING75_05620 [Rhodocyclaceae bacterium]|nr:hypothetical protein [Rhodocyclaceae bacterium]